MSGKERKFLKMMFIPSVTQACWQKTTFFFYFHFKWNPYRGKKDVLHVFFVYIVTNQVCVFVINVCETEIFLFYFYFQNRTSFGVRKAKLRNERRFHVSFVYMVTNQAPVAQVLQLKIYDRCYETKRLRCLLNRTILNRTNSATFNY